MVHGTQYVEEGLQKYEQRAVVSQQRTLSKLASKFGMQLVKAPVAA
jgi:hypothetical protein